MFLENLYDHHLVGFIIDLIVFFGTAISGKWDTNIGKYSVGYS